MNRGRYGDRSRDVLPVIHSIFESGALARVLEHRYDIGEISDCALYRSYANDVFRIITVDGEQYYLKVYRGDWRSPSDVAWEIRIQLHLLRNGVSAAKPVTRRDGSGIVILDAPEGQRAAVLYAAARGHKPQRPFTAELYEAFGRAAARLHTALDTFPDPSGRAPDDIEALVLAPGRILRALVDMLPDARVAVDTIVERLASELDRQTPALDWGLCHGDLTLDNFTIAEDGAITFFDFDLAAQSWRARDPCGVYASSRLNPDAGAFWDAFLAGYRAMRPLGEADEGAVPLMHAVYQLWDLGHEVSRWSAWSGQWRVTPALIAARLEEIQHWIDTELS